MKRNPIHKTIQALALLLFAFATVASAANVTLQTDADGQYVVMPKKGTDYLTIPEGVTSFRVKSYNAVYSCQKKLDGYLVLNAPEGFLFQIEGKHHLFMTGGKASASEITTTPLGSLKIYDGPDASANDIYKSIYKTVDPITHMVYEDWHNGYMPLRIPISSSNTVMVGYSVDWSKVCDEFNSGSGFSMTVTVIPRKKVTFVQPDVGGTATINRTWAPKGDTVTVTATPAKGYLLKGLEIKAGNSVLDNVSIGGVDWYSDATTNTVQFVMPDADISVKPIFTNYLTAEGGLYINMLNKARWVGENGVGWLFTQDCPEYTIPDEVVSFKVYDSGGKDGNYLSPSDCPLKLRASSGKLFKMTGSMQIEANCDAVYLAVYDGEFLKSNKIRKCGNGKTTDFGTFVSSGNAVAMELFSQTYGGGHTTLDGFDLTVEMLNGSPISLSESESVDYKEVSRTDPLTLYANMKYEDKFLYTLEYRHSEGAGWSGWDALRKDNGFEQDIGYVFDQSDVVNGFYAHSFEIPYQYLKAPYEYMEFRYKIQSYDENDVIFKTSYTNSVKVRLKNKVIVNAKSGSISGDYMLSAWNGRWSCTKDQLFDYGEKVQVEAIAPSGYKFTYWSIKGNSTHYTDNPISIDLVSDTTLQAHFETKSQQITAVTYVSKNGKDTYTENSSPNFVDVTKRSEFYVTARVDAPSALCPDDGCWAIVVFREVGTEDWIELGDYIKLRAGSYSQEKTFGMSKTGTWDGNRFEIKTIVTKAYDEKREIIAESNSIFANYFVTLSLSHCISEGVGQVNDQCSAIVEDVVGNKQNLTVFGNVLTFPYGAKVKLHPVYDYAYDFSSWKDEDGAGSMSELYKPTYYFTKDEVTEITMNSNKHIAMGLTRAESNNIEVLPKNQKLPYAGMTEFGLVLSSDGENGYERGYGVDFANDTAFFIRKDGLTDLFAVNKLDSMFTPGHYYLTVKTVSWSSNSTRDSLRACNLIPWLKWDGKTMGYIADNDRIKCTETTPAVFYYHYSFTVNDTSFNVTFNMWDEENSRYVTVGETQKVAFGEVPATPDIDCPESNTDWKFSCNWATAFAPAVKDTAYTYQVVRSNSVLSIASVDGSKTATIAGSYNGNDAFKITETVDVDNVELQRSFNQSKSGFSTIVLPFNFNASALTGVKSVIKFNRMTKNNGKLAVGMGYVWCDADVEASLKAEAAKTENPDDYDHCNSDWETFPGEMEAYTPYMVQMKNNQIGFDYVGGVMFEKTPDESEIQVSKEADDGVWEFRGTTQKKVWTAEETKDGYVWGFAAQIMGPANYIGKFVQLGEGASAEPLRAYMVFKPKDSNPPAQQVAPRNASFAAKPAKSLGTETASLPDEIDVVIESQGKDGEEHRTVIGTFTRSSGEFKMLRDYDLKGRKVNGVNKARGAYYGKKVLKK